MGWGDVLKIAGKIASEYVEKRGIDGVIEDAGKVVDVSKKAGNAVSSFFSGSNNSGDGEYGSQFVDYIEQLMEEKQFEQAISELDSFYEGVEKDASYYMYFASIHVRWLESMDLDDPKWNKISHKTEAAINRFRKKDVNNEFFDFQLDFKERYENLVEGYSYIGGWNTTIEMFENLIRTDRYQEARDTIKAWYSDHSEKYDFYYYEYIIKSYYFEFLTSESVLEPEKKIKDVKLALEKSSMLIDDPDKQEDYEQLSERVNEIVEKYELTHSKSITSQTTNAKALKQNGRDLNMAEKEYLEEYRACIDNDGVISDKERRLLNRLAKSLGLSEQRVRQLEDSLSSLALSDEEQEYYEEYKACLDNDGVISDKERRLLNRLAKSLDITVERQREIERG